MGTEQALYIDATQRWRIDAMPVFVRTDVADGMRGRIGVPVRMAVEASDTLVRPDSAAVLRGIELRLGKRRYQEPQALQLFRIQSVFEQGVVVVECDELAFGYIAEIRPRRQVDWSRKLGQEMIRQIEIEVEARQVASGLTLRFIDELLWKNHAARFVMRMRQRIESCGPEVLVLDVVRCHGCKLFPGCVPWKADTHPRLDSLAAGHRDACRRPVAKLVAFLEKLLLAFSELRFFSLQPLDQCIKTFLTQNGRCTDDQQNKSE